MILLDFLEIRRPQYSILIVIRDAKKNPQVSRFKLMKSIAEKFVTLFFLNRKFQFKTKRMNSERGGLLH